MHWLVKIININSLYSYFDGAITIKLMHFMLSEIPDKKVFPFITMAAIAWSLYGMIHFRKCTSVDEDNQILINFLYSV